MLKKKQIIKITANKKKFQGGRSATLTSVKIIIKVYWRMLGYNKIVKGGSRNDEGSLRII